MTDPTRFAAGLALPRRRVLQAAGIGGAAMVAAACGAGNPGASSTGPVEAKTQPDQSETEKSLVWSTWVSYIDQDEETGNRPTVDAFTAETGIKVDYREDINDNASFFAKVRPQLEAGQDIGRDIVVLTDWMAGEWVRSGYAQRFDRANVPNSDNLIERLKGVPFDPERNFTLPWQSGYAGLGFNSKNLEKYTGKTEIKTIEELWDPQLKGRVTILSEMRDSVGLVLLDLGYDPAQFTEDQFNEAIAVLQEQIDRGQIRQVTGNDYLEDLKKGNVVAAFGWSGDVVALGEDFGFNIPESGGTLWTDNMLVPAMARHLSNAEQLMDYYYRPEVAAEVAAWVQYICPVDGAREAMEKLDPELVDNPYIFPTEEDLARVSVFMPLTAAEQNTYEQAFQATIGN
jgi:spermidine/putrescine transport system substrate-binding protein